MFEHFIITRFNLRQENWDTTKNKTQINSEFWIKNRFELFDKYCFPTVKAQTNQNFKWLVFFDVQTPKEYREIVVNYVRDYNNFIPLFIDGMKSFNQELIKYISNCERNIL